MKRTKLIVLFIISLLSEAVFAQKELYGDWYVSCVFDSNDRTGETICTLCPVIKRDTGFTIQSFSMKINSDEIELNMNYQLKVVKYKWDDKERSIEFSYNQTVYTFKILFAGVPPPAANNSNSRYILKDKNDRLLLLDPK
jgi:hypothetical protein